MLPTQTFESVFVQGRNIDEVWFKLLYELCLKGRFYKVTDGSYAGDFRLEFDNVDGIIEKPIEYTDAGVRLPISPTVPQGCPAPCSDEDLEKYKENYLKNSDLAVNEHYKYATFITGGGYKIPSVKLVAPNYVYERIGTLLWWEKLTKRLQGINYGDPIIRVPNQLEWCKNHFRKKGFGNNHCCIAVAYPESNLAYDIPYSNEMERHTSPCLRLIDMKIVYDESVDYYFLNWYVYFRSQDLYGGWPVNYGGLALLLEETAYDLGIFPGFIKFSSKGLHVYGHAIEPLVMRSGNTEVVERFNKIKKLYE